MKSSQHFGLVEEFQFARANFSDMTLASGKTHRACKRLCVEDIVFSSSLGERPISFTQCCQKQLGTRVFGVCKHFLFMVRRCLKTPFILRQPSVGSHLCDATRRIRVIWYAADLAGHGPGHRLCRICEDLRAVPALSQRPSGEAWIDMEFFSASISPSGKRVVSKKKWAQNGLFFFLGKDRYLQVPDSDCCNVGAPGVFPRWP